MSSPRRQPRSSGTLEDDDILSEILLRLPPRPSSLPRASLVCKRWHGLASDPGFFRRFRRHHRRNPPLIGFFASSDDLSFVPTLDDPDRVPPGRFSLERVDGDRFMSLGCRHGLVLIFNITPNQMLVWDPVTGDQHRLAIPLGIGTHAEKTTVNGAVLRAAGGGANFQFKKLCETNFLSHYHPLESVYTSETRIGDEHDAADLLHQT
ncbi:hypothetical protein ACQ4PT_043139 [Festuca glaucescens]